jgi:two-component system, response regulator YesN
MLATASNRTEGRPQILVVDDDVIVAEIITLFLSATCDVETAATGAEALKSVRRDRVHLVVLDHRLPDRTGLDVLVELRSSRPTLPVIMLTGYGSEWICAEAFKLGANDYLVKPVSAHDLVGAVQRILPCGLDECAPERDAGGPPRSAARGCLPVQRVMGLIQRRYWERLPLAELARQVGMSKHRLSRRFREVIGVTFRDYLQKVRLERAKVLLAAGHRSITEVAQDVGFADLPRFDKVFKRYTGVTPSDYRSATIRPATNSKDPATNY